MGFIFFILIVLTPISYASIEILGGLEGDYNLGEDIGFSLKLVSDENVDSLIKLTLKCTEKEVPYYISPLSLKKSIEKIVDAPKIKAFSEGLCTIKVNLEDLNGGGLDGITSNEFKVSSLLDLTITSDKKNVLPGDIIKIKGSALKKGNKIDEGIIVISVGGKKGEVELNNKDFSYELKLDEDIKSGEHMINLEVRDPYDNYGQAGIDIFVEAVPKTFELELNRNEFFPKETMEFIAYLVDQAEDPINGDVKLKLIKKKTLLRDEIVIFDVLVNSNMKYYFGFNYSTLPYEYKLEGIFDDIDTKKTITILDYPKIEMIVSGDKVIVKNMGNVRYNNDTTIVLENMGNKYILNKRIKLDVGEEMEIDLSKEVIGGSYTVTLPEDTSIEENSVEEKVLEKGITSVVKKEALASTGVEKESVQGNQKIGKTVGLNANRVIENVEIEDNRPAYKKGMGWITGGVIAGAGILMSSPRSASVIMIIVILSLMGYFNRKKVGKFIEKIREKREKKF